MIDNDGQTEYMGMQAGGSSFAFEDTPSDNAFAPWFCIQTAANAEIRTFDELSHDGFKAYLPRYVIQKRHYGRVIELKRALFPTYLFVSFDAAANEWGRIYRVPGVRKMFTNSAGRPRQMRLGEIERLMALGRAGDGMIDDTVRLMAPIPPGTKLRITEGPFADWSAVCKWSDGERVGVLLTMFAAERVVPMARASVEVV